VRGKEPLKKGKHCAKAEKEEYLSLQDERRGFFDAYESKKLQKKVARSFLVAGTSQEERQTLQPARRNEQREGDESHSEQIGEE